MYYHFFKTLKFIVCKFQACCAILNVWMSMCNLQKMLRENKFITVYFPHVGRLGSYLNCIYCHHTVCCMSLDILVISQGTVLWNCLNRIKVLTDFLQKKSQIHDLCLPTAGVCLGGINTILSVEQ